MAKLIPPCPKCKSTNIKVEITSWGIGLLISRIVGIGFIAMGIFILAEGIRNAGTVFLFIIGIAGLVTPPFKCKDCKHSFRA